MQMTALIHFKMPRFVAHLAEAMILCNRLAVAVCFILSWEH